MSNEYVSRKSKSVNVRELFWSLDSRSSSLLVSSQRRDEIKLVKLRSLEENFVSCDVFWSATDEINAGAIISKEKSRIAINFNTLFDLRLIERLDTSA